MSPLDLLPLGADLILIVGALSLLTADVVLPHGDKRVLAIGALATLLAALVATLGMDLSGASFGGAYVGDDIGLWFKRTFYAAGILAILGGLGSVPDRFVRRQGEYYELLLFSILGMSLLAGATDLLLLLVAFELMGIPLYVLAAFDRTDTRATEGALKLFLTGALSTVAIFFGASLLTGMAGSTELIDLARHVVQTPTPLSALGALMMLAGMGFKLGLVPFHMWVPDTYQGASTPFVAFLSTAPKAAAAVAILRIVLPVDGAVLQGGGGVLVGLAALTLVLGNLLALGQGDVKRLLAYSGVAHIGFVVLALTVHTPLGVASLVFYVVAYLFSNLGAFLVVHAVARAGGDDSVGSFDGLAHRHQGLAMSMLAFLLSLAGIPFVVGFWAKLFVFAAAWSAGHAWIVVLGAVFSVVGLFYYLRIARAMFMNAPPDASRPAVDRGAALAIGVCVLLVLGLGLAPGPLMEALMRAADALIGA